MKERGGEIQSRRAREEVLNRFEEAWQRGARPLLVEFLPSLSAAGPASDFELFLEIVKIDLEFRWKQQPTLSRTDTLPAEQYLQWYPSLIRFEQLLLGVIGEEYRARHRWADRPGHPEYTERFPRHRAHVLKLLRRIDAELASEISWEGRPPISRGDFHLIAIARGTPIMNSPVATVSGLIDTLRQCQLLSQDQWSILNSEEAPKRFSDPRALARQFLERGWLTPYQVNQLLQGRGRELIIGPYVLLERLGEGGVGQVFKARHSHMNRVVALKLIRKDLMTDKEVIDRFQREIHAISQLTHPHIVHAYDAGPAGANFFLAMEYVEGKDLSRLVKQKGSLPVVQACDYIWQAALGLQHLHEHSLIHRDIKPANLLLASARGLESVSVVKILDLGLARLLKPLDEATAGLTATNSLMMGTLDYMAPEQALDFHQVDIRADIYSLGCTFRYLLTGQPPYPEGTLAQKLHRHQNVEPTPIEQLRKDVPPTLTSIIQKMMAKRREARFQTPGEIAQLLGVSLGRAILPGSLPASRGNLVPVAIRVDAPLTKRPPMALVVASTANVAVPASRPLAERCRTWLRRLRSRERRIAVAGLILLLLVVLSLSYSWLGGSSSNATDKVYLSDLTESDVSPRDRFGKNGMGQWISVKEAFRLSVAGQVAPKGLFMYPPSGGTSFVRYRLEKQYKKLTTAVAINDNTGKAETPITFVVLVDNEVRWKSKPCSVPRSREECTVSVAGGEVLELAVSCPGPNGSEWPGSEAFVVWVDPYLTK